MSKINIIPLADRILVEPAAAETKTSSGIIIPDSAKEKPQKGKVVAVGPGTKENPVTLKVGDDVTIIESAPVSKRKRWVVYKGEINASKITSDWFSWIHHITDRNPSEIRQKKYSWQKPHEENKTGTKKSYRPNKITKNAKDFKKYETWKH